MLTVRIYDLDMTNSLQATVEYCIIGLRMLQMLVSEMNQPTTGRTLSQHRKVYHQTYTHAMSSSPLLYTLYIDMYKVAVSFRDQALFRIFQISLTTLRQISTRQISVSDGTLPLPSLIPLICIVASQESAMIEAGLQLALSCLSFDFIGTNPDESGEDIGTLQVPSAWRPVFEESATMQLFFDFYANCKPPQSARVCYHIQGFDLM